MTAASEATRDKVSERLAQMLMMAFQNKPINREEAMERFGVTSRTFYRDINRLSSIIQRNDNGNYELAPEYQSRLSKADLEKFASLAGIDGMFPHFGPRFLEAVLHTMTQDSYLVKGLDYENHDAAKLSSFKVLEKAIENRQVCRIVYKDKTRHVEPYKLINYRGIWYLAGVDDNILKAFNISKISMSPLLTDQHFSPDEEVIERIEQEDSIWFSEDKQEVILKVKAEVAYYFERRKLFPKQDIVRNLANGELIISCQMSHPNQILPLIRYWLPNISIISPASLQQKLLTEINQYLSEHSGVC